MVSKLFSKKNKYAEMKSQSLRSIEDFTNAFIESQAGLLKENQNFSEALKEFSVAVEDIDILDSQEKNLLKIEHASKRLAELDYPIRCAFYFELLDNLDFSPFISMLADEVFQRVMFKLEKEDDYEKYDKLLKEILDKHRTANIVANKEIN
jgi:hypothetical protein